MANIGFLGLGKMGSGMASCLLAAGHRLTVWNRSPEKTEGLIGQGALPANSPAEAAADADAVFAMVADDAASSRCWLDGDGAMGALHPGAFVIECSTISHGHSEILAKAAAEKGLAYIDCPVNGPPSAAAAGELILLVGADAGDLEQARPFLEAISSTILHFGGTGTGTAYKLINNLLGAVHVASIAEAAHLARKLGLDVDTTVAAAETGPIGSPHVKRMIRPMLENRAADTFGLAIGLREKDSRYCLSMAHAMGLSMPVGEQAYAWYEAAAEVHGAKDDSAMLQTIAAYDGKKPS